MLSFRGSEGPFDPKGSDVKGRLNVDYYANRKAQGWWNLRTRFRNTFRLVKQGKPCSHDEIICIPSTLPYCTKLTSELSQPTYGQSTIGKMLINKAPDGVKSPNLADAIMMCFWPLKSVRPMVVTAGILQRAQQQRPMHGLMGTRRL